MVKSYGYPIRNFARKCIINLIIKLQGTKLVVSEYQEDISRPVIPYSIVISTFEKRLFKYALPLLKQLRSQTNAEIIVIVNGNLGTPRDSEILQKFLGSISKFASVFPLVFTKFYGCSYMWNRGIQNCTTENILVLNDDVILLNNNFENEIQSIIAKIDEIGAVTLNGSWSHFIIKKTCIGKVGWFEERLLGIGQEDGDYALRYEKILGRKVGNFTFSNLLNVVDDSADDKVAKNDKLYSLFNNVFIAKKYLDDPQGILGMFDSPKVQSITDQDFYPSSIWVENSVELLSSTNENDIALLIEKILGNKSDY